MLLRRLERKDLDVLVDWLDDAAFRRFIYGDDERLKRQMGSHILALLGGALSMPTAAAGHFVCDAGERGPVGLASVFDLCWRNRSCTVSTYKAPGSSPEAFYDGACYGILEYCFDELNLHRAATRVDAKDEAAWQAYERAGARREAVLRGHGLRDGQPSDVYGYGVLRGEFELARKGRPQEAGV